MPFIAGAQFMKPIPYTHYAGYTPKRLAIFCDGTWQSIRAERRTNVALAAMGVERYGPDGRHQLTYYDDGVGALIGGWRRMFVGATGQGLDNRILSAYRFLTLNYEPGDEIYLFGFSRGAYTVRSLTGLIRTCGILRREYAHREQEAMDLYRRPRTQDGTAQSDSPEAIEFRMNCAREWVRPESGALTAMGGGRDTLKVAYVGVWDTVGALGIPSTLFQNRKRYQFHDTSLGKWVKMARHAVAIDERRTAFAPTLWSNVDGGADAGDHPGAQQCWFPGDHGGVGGGAARNGLSNAALLWIIEGAQAGGLSFKQSILDEYVAELEPLRTPVRQTGIGSWFTYLSGADWRRGLTQFEDVHETARQRYLQNKTYRPKPLKPFKDRLKAWETHGDVAG